VKPYRVWFDNGSSDVVPSLFYQTLVLFVAKFESVHPIYFPFRQVPQEDVSDAFVALQEYVREEVQDADVDVEKNYIAVAMNAHYVTTFVPTMLRRKVIVSFEASSMLLIPPFGHSSKLFENNSRYETLNVHKNKEVEGSSRKYWNMKAST